MDKRNKPVCIKCRNKIHVIPIVYGYPSSETFRQRDIGKIALGGCIIQDDNPKWHCSDCDFDF